MNNTVREHTFITGHKLQIAQGDITAEATEAIVNAANRYLEHGAGVAGAIVRKGGLQIQSESREWVRAHGLVEHDQPAYTHAGNLACRYVIHAVGPVWGEGDEPNKLAAAVHASLEVAERLGLASIAFPAISTGIFGFPRDEAVRVMLSTIRGWVADNPEGGLKLIDLVLYDQETLDIFTATWDQDDLLAA